ncbi:alginate export family protein [Methylomicrobium sp. Wu6]|uniref:alginate export family protein n=1 Tax=Methylomicrobium sp. Wu6 TaxID=3107928 RepID=UPI002DD692FC|nr:alginate export family protein [Methylomicrobium sp. Wu6]MEC4749179.1 alginate export family protein [Methylomicrobium sp. Wu6]
MSPQNTLVIDSRVAHTIGLIIVSAGLQAYTGSADAEEKKSYTQPPFTSFSSQMPDALLGSYKYKKPVWNLHDALDLPEWLSVSLDQRTRYETMDGSFRKGSQGGDQQIPLQTDLWLEAHLRQWRVGGEFLDARQFASDKGSQINNTQVDEADFIQGYLAWADQNVMHSGLGVEAIAGRQTLNFGSRRLVARNNFRNTINSFDGFRLRVLDYNHWQFNAFVSKPVGRYPNDSNQLLDHFHSFDEPEKQTWFSGGFLEVYDLPGSINAELYLYHLDEGDRNNRSPTRNRRYFTPGFRFYIKPAKGEFDFQNETIGQWGTVRATTAASDNKTLDHSAWYQHLDVGYTFAIPWSPRFALEYDYASGDHNPNDNKDQRFDTLFGARRFDFGPTGIYGAFARSNINTPGVRIGFSPRPDVQAFISHRFFWLAENKDAWTAAGLQDKTGKSGSFIGQQLELSARYDFNSSLNFETGWAHLFKGTFAKNAPGAPAGKDVDYFYVQSLFRF